MTLPTHTLAVPKIVYREFRSVKRGARVSVGINETTTADVNEPARKDIFSGGGPTAATPSYSAICVCVNNI